MKQKIIILCLYFIPTNLVAQYPSNMNGYIASSPVNVTFVGKDQIPLEIPPWTIGGGWHTYLMVDGSNTKSYSTPDNLIDKTTVNCKYTGSSFNVGPEASKPWKRSYSSIYSAHYLLHPTQGTINIGFCHDENKNSCHNQNTINSLIHPTCISGTDWPGYFALVSAVWTKNVESTNWGQGAYNNDVGPILWPTVGYVSSDNKNASQGLLQPSSIVSGNYIYIFIWDKGPLPGISFGQEGRGRGVKLVRTTIANCTNENSYEVYYKNPQGVVSWLPSLPLGFTKETMLQYVKVPGPKSTDILFDQISNNTECFRFSAAKVNNQNYFIGCEEYVDNNDNGRHHIALRFSNDLINWSARQKIVETSYNWDESLMNYPILLSADGWSNTAIDLNNFYIIGTHSHSPFASSIDRINVSLYVPPPFNPNQPKPNPCGPNVKCPPSMLREFSSVNGNFSEMDNSFTGISPNPTHGNFQFSYILYENTLTRLNLLDITGKRISTGIFKSNGVGIYKENIYLGNKSKGIYILEFFKNGVRSIYKVLYN